MRLHIPLIFLGTASATTLPRRDLPQGYEGKFMLIIEGDAVAGRADELQQLFSAVRESATDPKKEPDTLTYRVARGFGDQSNKFTTVEEYLNPEALEFHQSTQVYQNLVNSGAINSFSQFFADEFF